jgi:D-xylose transport system substrate-binding protein
MGVRIGLVVASLILSVALGLLIGRGDGEVRSDDTLRIGLSLDTLKEERWQNDSEYFKAAAQKLGAEVSIQSANGDDTVQLQNVQGLLASGVDVLVMVPHDGQAMSKAVELAHEARVPVLAYDRMIMNCDLNVYMSFDNVRVGRAQAQYLVDAIGGNGKIVRIYGAKTDNNAKLFKKGQDEVLQPYIERGDIEVVWEDWAEDWKPANAKKITSAAITAGKNFSGILASNDGTAGGAIEALRDAGLAGKVAVTGQDAELAACQRIVNGTQAMTVYKPLKKLAARAAESAVRMGQAKPVLTNDKVNNGKIDVPSVLVPVVVVTKENMIDTVIADGYQSYDDVYRGVPEDQRPPRP